MAVENPQSPEWSEPTDVAILVLKNLDHDARVLKESQTFARAGLNVVRVGIITRSSEPEWERTNHDRILRIRTTDRLASERSSTSGIAPIGSARETSFDDLRYWLGRWRENRIAADVVARLHPRIIIACDLNTLRAGVLLKRSLGCHLVYDAHELFTDRFPKRWLYRALWRGTERRLIRRADRVITVNSQRADELAARYGIPKPDVVLNGPTICYEDATEVASPVRFLYQGGLFEARGLDMLVRAMVPVRGRAVLSFQGFGSARGRLEMLSEQLGLRDTVRFIDPVPPGHVVDAARHHDVGVVMYRSETLNDYLAAPNKLFDYMGAGLAVLGVRLPMIEQVVEQEGVGVLFEPDDIETLVSAMVRLVDDVQAVREMKQRSLAACPRYSWSAQEPILLEAAGVRPCDVT